MTNTIDRVAERLFPDDAGFLEAVRVMLGGANASIAEAEATHGPGGPDDDPATGVAIAWAIIAAFRFHGDLAFAAKARHLLTEFTPGTFPADALARLLPVELTLVQVLELTVLGDAVEAAGATSAVHREVAALIRYIASEGITRAQLGGRIAEDERRRLDIAHAFAACCVYETRDQCLPGFSGRDAMEAAGVKGLHG